MVAEIKDEFEPEIFKSAIKQGVDPPDILSILGIHLNPVGNPRVHHIDSEKGYMYDSAHQMEDGDELTKVSPSSMS